MKKEYSVKFKKKKEKKPVSFEFPWMFIGQNLGSLAGGKTEENFLAGNKPWRSRSRKINRFLLRSEEIWQEISIN